MQGLVYVGRVVDVAPIAQADRLELATVVCGKGGKWRGVVQKGQFAPGDLGRVYLQDSIVPRTDEFAFMDRMHYRVRMARFRGAPSEVLIMPLNGTAAGLGDDITAECSVTKYEKPLPASCGGEIAGVFPSFIPKTDEPNVQKVLPMLDALKGDECYATLKMDGTSSTAYYHDGHFGVCSRNYELKESGANVLWRLARQYDLEAKFRQYGDVAVQWETCGPGIQGNTAGLTEPSMFVFNVWRIDKQAYLGLDFFRFAVSEWALPTPKVVHFGMGGQSLDWWQGMAEGCRYPNGHAAEGIVVRPTVEQQVVVDDERMRCSFKVLNLAYREG